VLAQVECKPEGATSRQPCPRWLCAETSMYEWLLCFILIPSVNHDRLAARGLLGTHHRPVSSLVPPCHAD